MAVSLRRQAALGLTFLLVCTLAAAAQAPVPSLEARVTDRTATLTPEQRAGLEQTLRTFEERKGSQIAVLMVPTAKPEAIEQYALRVAEQWKIGRRNVDDGAILVIAKNDRALRIEVGYGLEGALTDATSRRIIDEIIVPRFREGDFYGGVAAGVDRMMRVIDGEPLPPPARRREPAPAGGGEYLPILFIAALVLGGLLRAVLGRVPGAFVTGGAVGLLGWLMAGLLAIGLIAGIIAFLFTLAGGGAMQPGWGHGGWHRGGHRGGWGGGGFRGGGGGFGGGGFRGGGGGFGGGGASGRW